MGVQVRFSPGHDIYYLPGRARPGRGGERTAGGYYVNAALAGEPSGRWFGEGAAALGLDECDEVDPAVHEKVFSQVDPHTGGRIGRGPARDTAEKRAAREAELARLLAAEPHATAARRHELERQAAQMHRVSRPYTDFTVAYSKSVSVVHASIRENARRAALAGDLAAEAYWADMEARYAGILFDGATVAMRHLERWAMTRAGFGRQVDDEQHGRYEPAGLTVSMWLQGTSRDGDPHDHVHCAIARMCLTLSDGRWRAHDTMTLRRQGGTAKLLASAYHLSAFTGALGLRWRPGADGNEVQGVAQTHMDAADAARQAGGSWYQIAHALRQVTTDARGHLSPAAAEAHDLALWTGRLAYTDPTWTPASGPHQPARPPQELAARPGDVPQVVAAVHHASEALALLAETEHDQLCAAAHVGRILVPTRSLPDDYNIPRPYATALPEHTGPLLARYRDAIQATRQATIPIGRAADATGAPSCALAATQTTPSASPAAKPEDQATPGGREQIRDMPGPLQQALLGLGITSPSLLARGADLDRASERLLIEAADELPSTQQRPPAATLNMTAGSATLLNHALASGNPQAARLVHQAGQAEREDPEPEP